MKWNAAQRERARQRFGFDEWRPGQEEAIASVMEGHDTAVLERGLLEAA